MNKIGKLSVLAAIALAPVAPAQQTMSQSGAVTVDPDGTSHFPNFVLPFSNLASPEAKKAYLDLVVRPYPVSSNVEQFRRGMDARLFQPELDRFKELYPVNIERTTIAGVPVDIVTPKGGVLPRNKNRVLINLHGGGFVIGGGGPSGLVEAVPIAGLGGFKVITVDYRMFPEFKFPAASEDVAAVYGALLEHYKAADIGIYGCSAGGILTAQSVAWFQTHGLPRPGAIGIMCASAGGFGSGDSGVLWPLVPTQPRNNSSGGTPPSATGYLAGTNPKDPLVAPIYSPNVLRNFPPTLILTSSRAAESSAAAYTDIQLTKLGVESEFHMWDGLGHGGYNTPDLPENKEADTIIVRFFDRHLSR